MQGTRGFALLGGRRRPWTCRNIGHDSPFPPPSRVALRPSAAEHCNTDRVRRRGDVLGSQVGSWLRGLPRQTTSSISMGDTLAQIGLQSPDWVRRQIAGWHVLFAQHAPDVVIADFAPGAIPVLDKPAALPERLRRSRLVVHAGGHGLSAAAILAGVPQVILSYDIEKQQYGIAMTRRGIAHWYDYRTADADMVRAGIISAFDDPVMEMEAGRASMDHAGYRNRDVAYEIAATCGRLIGR